MLTFLRKIRKSLSDAGSARKPASPARPNGLLSGRAGRYLLYAIGEIGLVVIGILIALQINNWNEWRKDRKAENLALINLKSEFDENQRRLDELFKRRRSEEKEIRAYLNSITDETIPLSLKISFKTPVVTTRTWGTTNTVLNSLISTGGIDRIQNDSLKFLITNRPVLVNRFTEIEARFINRLEKFQDFENSIVPMVLIKEGDYSATWPETYYPNSMVDRLPKLREELIRDIRNYNHLASILEILYIYSIRCVDLRDNYEKISRLIIKELEARNTKLNK